MAKEEDCNRKKSGEEKGGGKERKKWRWRQTRECATTGLIWLCAQCRGGMQSWGREGEKQADKQEGINGRERWVCIRGMRLLGSKILSWTLGDYSTGHHMMDCGLRVFGRQHCTCQVCLSQTERCCMLSLSEDGSGCYVTSLGAARLFTSVFKISLHSWIVDTKHSLFLVLCEDACLTDTKSISSQTSVLWKNLITKPWQEICSFGLSYSQRWGT